MNTSRRLTYCAMALVLVALCAGCGSAQSRKAGYIQHGRDYFAAGNLEKARVEFSNAAQIDPKDAEVHLWLGKIAEKTGNAREAVGQYQAAINENPKLAAARTSLARLFLFGGLADRAMSLVEPGLKMEPNNAQLLTVRGAARQRLGDTAGALIDAEAAVKLDPKDDYGVALLASLYRQHGQTDKAIALVESALERLPNDIELRVILADLYVGENQPQQAETQLKKILALEPKVLAHRYRVANFYLSQKNPDAAEQVLRDAVAAAPDNDEPKVQLVQFLAAQRGNEQAAAEIERFLAKSSGDDGLRLAFGQLLAKAGAADKAEKQFQAVIDHSGLNPDGLLARSQLASVRLAKGDAAGATALVSEVLKQNPRDNNALILRANMSMATGDTPSAIADLRAVLRDQPNSVPLIRALARAYATNGEPDLAEEALRTALQLAPQDPASRLDLAQVMIGDDKLNQADPLLEQLAKENANDMAVQQALFRVRAAQKRYAEARATAETIQKAQPSSATGYYLAGLIDDTEGKSEAATRDYEQALKLQPDAGEPLIALAKLDMRMKRPAKALERADAVIARFPRNAVAYRLKADLLLLQGKQDASIAAYQSAIAAVPEWAPAYQGLADAQLTAKRPDEAIRVLRQGVENTHAAPELVGSLSALLEHLGRVDEAIAMYEGVLSKYPKSSYAANNLAMLLVTHKTDPASLSRAQKLAEQLAPYSVVSLIDTRGWVKFKSGDYRGAEVLLQQALDKAPGSPEVRYHLGMAQLRSGEQQTAAQNLEAAVRSAQPFQGMEEAKAVLAQLTKGASAG